MSHSSGRSGPGWLPPPRAGLAVAPAAVTPVWPTPQSVVLPRPGGFPLPARVALVTGRGADRAAVGLVHAVLRAVGVEVLPEGRHADTVVHLGDDAPQDPTGRVLAELGVRGPEGLPAGGYVLATGTGGDGVRHLVLHGVDPAGAFYAAQSLRQLLGVGPDGRGPAVSDGTAGLPWIEIRDWPDVALRGTIEGFYGAPWSHRDRLDHLDFLGRTKQNAYVYSPKDDPYLRERWRDRYPEDWLGPLRALVERARANHVEFTYALSPGLTVCYSLPADLRALLDKFQVMWDLGVRSFAVPLDDVPIDRFPHEEDAPRFGAGEAALGLAQSHLLNEVKRAFIDTHPGAHPLQMVPTAYASVRDRPYKQALREHLDPGIVVEWTGEGVVAPLVSAEQARAAMATYGHQILLWDNYPTNDYVTSRLLLGPYTGRDAGAARLLAGITANPMNQEAPSRIALFTSAGFGWNADAYDAEAALDAAVADLGGSAASALRVLVDNSRSCELSPTESPALTALVDAFWAGWDGAVDLGAAARDLDLYFQRMTRVPHGLAREPGLVAFVEQAGPWIGKLAAYGRAGRTAVRTLLAVRAGDRPHAEREARALGRQRRALDAIVQQVAVGVMDPFLDRVAKEAASAR